MPLPSPELLPSETLYPSMDPEDATLLDYEVPNGTEAIYRARSAIFISADAAVSSDWAYAEQPVAWQSEDFWLKHPTRPSLNVSTGLMSPATSGTQRGARDGRFQALGSSEAVLISDAREAETGTIQLRCDTDEQAAALVALADEQVPVLFQCRGGDHEPDRWLVLGAHTRERMIDKAWAEGTWHSFEWTRVERPEGNLAE